MELRNLLALLAFFIVSLTSGTVLARRGVASTSNLDNGSGYDLDDSGSGEDPNIDEGSADYDDDDEDIRRPVHPPLHRPATGSPNRDVLKEQTARFRSTTSVYNYPVDIGAIDENDVRAEPKPLVFSHPAVLAAIVVGGVLVILCVVLLVMFLVYRMRKKDEGSYILDDPKTMIVGNDHYQQQQNSSVVYMKAPTNDREFYA